MSTFPLEVIGAPLVIVEALESLTVAALMAPIPVFTVEDVPVLEIVTPCAAVMVGELVVV
jgi:predicted aconitase with swiveling domain